MTDPSKRIEEMQERLDEVQEEIDEARADAERVLPHRPEESFIAGEDPGSAGAPPG